jgi:capsular polysaccharide transport system permease protein
MQGKVNKIQPQHNNRLLLAGPSRAATVVRRTWRMLTKVILLVSVFLPSFFAIVYYGAVASERYVTESSFVVRSATQPTAGAGFASLLKLVGISPTQDNAYAVLEFMTSQDAFVALNEKLDLRAIYGVAGADPIAKYPNFLFGDSREEFSAYLKRRIIAKMNPNTGISTITVEAFRREDAKKIAEALLSMGEEFVNGMNERLRNDAIKFSQSEVELARERLRSAELEVSTFRNREALIDPSQSSVIVLELIAQLSSRLNTVEVQAATSAKSTPESPRADAIRQQISALKEQISAEQSRLTAGNDALSNKISEYEKIILDRQFAAETLTRSLDSLERAKAEARRQQLYLETVVAPNMPDSSTAPRRGFEISSLVVLNLIVLLVGWLLKNGIAEHAPNLIRKGAI